LNTNMDLVDDLLDGTTAISPNLSTLTIAGTAVTATAAELNYVDGVTSAIQTQLDEKALSDSPTLTGTPTAPTATTATDTTQIATTAFVQQEITANAVAIAEAYPVGSIYMNASNATNPSTLLGFGTWVALAAGKMLVGIDSGDTDFDTAGETGGAKEVTLTEGQLPAHQHRSAFGEYNTPQNLDFGNNGVIGNFVTTGAARGYGVDSESIGSGDAIDIMNPYIVVYMWKRTA
jgi:hypothetical protein